jgi:hypothetical protein
MPGDTRFQPGTRFFRAEEIPAIRRIQRLELRRNITQSGNAGN